jgi:hypothetical protein
MAIKYARKSDVSPGAAPPAVESPAARPFQSLLRRLRQPGERLKHVLMMPSARASIRGLGCRNRAMI